MIKINSKNKYAGIDCSKNTLEVFVEGAKKSKCFGSGAGGMSKLVNYLTDKRVTHVGIESTGGYEIPISYELMGAGIAISVVNPSRVHSFRGTLGIEPKTDPVDSWLICEYMSKIKPRRSELVSQEILQLRRLACRRNQLVELGKMEKTHMKSGYVSSEQVTSTTKMLALLKQEQKEIEEKMEATIAANKDLASKRNQLQTAPGIGKIVSIVLLVQFPELGKLDRYRIASLLGVAPYPDSSGKTSNNKVKEKPRHIRGGRKMVRNLIYMSALVAVRNNAEFKSYYKNLRSRGKQHKVALVACMRKLIVSLNAMVRDGHDWSDAYFTKEKDLRKNSDKQLPATV